MLCIAKQCNNVTNREDAILTITTKHKKIQTWQTIACDFNIVDYVSCMLPSLSAHALVRPPKSDPSRERSVSPPNTRFVVPT